MENQMFEGKNETMTGSYKIWNGINKSNKIRTIKESTKESVVECGSYFSLIAHEFKR